MEEESLPDRKAVSSCRPTDRSASRGEIVLSTRYRGWRGAPFPWVYLAEEDLAKVARDAGYEVERLGRVERGEYLFALQAKPEGEGR